MASVNHRVRVTIRDVASRAGVSAQTVSRVVNEHPDVADDTRERVQRVIAQLHYRPNGIARSLVTQRASALGVVASGFQLFGPAQLLTGIERQATELNWQLLLQIVDPNERGDYERIAANLVSQNVDGVIWAYPELTSEREHALHRQIRPFAPIVFLSMGPQPESAVLNIDNRAGARMAVEHLIERGRRHIGVLAGPQHLWSARERVRGWEDALAAARLPHGAKQIVEGDWSAVSGEAGLTKLHRRLPKLDAVFVGNDQMALGALKAADQLGLAVPRDLAVAGFDNSPESAFFKPSLTTVHHDLIELGRLAVRELDRVIAATRAGKPTALASFTLQPSLMIREST
jgi:DNA-binding LacI/PurR family transcriptional regulator